MHGSVSAEAPDVLGVARSLSGRRWQWRGGEERVALGISQRLGASELMGRLLASRGVGIEEAAGFLAPSLRASLPDPSSLAGMDAAATRLAEAVGRGETVGIFADYDVDGACSAALLADVLAGLGCVVHVHVPDRIAEGYGPNPAGLGKLVGLGARLIVCVDCGTAAGAVLAGLCVDVLVLDHHKSDDVPASAVATVNPNWPGCRSGLHGLCATAIVFLACVALLRALRCGGFFERRVEPDLRDWLDLVALATVCDVMPLTGVNRVFVSQGVRVMARRARVGIAALLDVAGSRGVPDAMSCGWMLGPRINAGGRIGVPDLGLRVLRERDPSAARALAGQLDAVNRQRQEVEAAMLDEAMKAAAAQIAGGAPVVLISGAEWHPGVVGIVAGRVKERFNRPALVAGVSGGMWRGSGRSVPGVDLGSAVIAAWQAGLLATGGGHAMAAGFSLAEADAGRFHAFLCERLVAAAAMPASVGLWVDGAVSVAGASVTLGREIAGLAPFGIANEEPVLVLPRVRVARADRVGREGGALRMFVEGEGSGRRLKAMLFRAGDGEVARVLASASGAPVHLAGHLRVDEWEGTERVGFVVCDAAVA